MNFNDFDDFENENIIIEIRALVDDYNNFEDDIDSYCSFMREIILNTSGLN